LQRVKPTIELETGDKLSVDGTLYHIGGHISDDEVGVREQGDRLYKKRHVDWFDELLYDADSVILVRE